MAAAVVFFTAGFLVAAVVFFAAGLLHGGGLLRGGAHGHRLRALSGGLVFDGHWSCSLAFKVIIEFRVVVVRHRNVLFYGWVGRPSLVPRAVSLTAKFRHGARCESRNARKIRYSASALRLSTKSSTKLLS
ncbi:hypothetical protein [Acidocella sp. MX-AZ02]|uniref:hypothetical protein n=1 Tax=Acidocella sp. MX-AZ02 TaxID=1214225 RepID=UPI00196A09E0|nr:hypothetical protein [Acidocella sp. MX-AZ02]